MDLEQLARKNLDSFFDSQKQRTIEYAESRNIRHILCKRDDKDYHTAAVNLLRLTAKMTRDNIHEIIEYLKYIDHPVFTNFGLGICSSYDYLYVIYRHMIDREKWTMHPNPCDENAFYWHSYSYDIESILLWHGFTTFEAETISNLYNTTMFFGIHLVHGFTEGLDILKTKVSKHLIDFYENGIEMNKENGPRFYPMYILSKYSDKVINSYRTAINDFCRITKESPHNIPYTRHHYISYHCGEEPPMEPSDHIFKVHVNGLRSIRRC